MTPKEKAEELVDKMKYPMDGVYIINHIANELAFIVVDQMIKELTEEISPSVHGFRHQYWQQVKHEIAKL
jgi:hypothetical protein